MKELFDLLDRGERKVLGLLCLLTLLSLLTFAFIGLREKKVCLRSFESLEAQKKQLQKIDLGREEKEREWQQWQQTFLDLAEVKGMYFYGEKEVVRQLRRDLQKLFNRAGIPVSSLSYDYAELEKEKTRLIKVSFTVAASYPLLKEFIQGVEAFPKFLVLEKIDFLNIDAETGAFRMKIVLAAYYES